MDDLREAWREQLKKVGIDETVKEEVKTTDKGLTANKSVNHALDHVFYSKFS